MMTCLVSLPASHAQVDAPFGQAPPPSAVSSVNYIDWLRQQEPDRIDDASSRYYSSFLALQPFGSPQSLDRAASAPWRPDPQVESWLEANARALNLYRWATRASTCSIGLRAASEQPGGAEWADALLFAVIPGIGAFELAAQGALPEGWRVRHTGDSTWLIDAAMANLTAAHHLSADAPADALFVALRITERTHEVLRRLLALDEPRGAPADDIVNGLTQWDTPLPGVARAYAFQRLMCYDTLQRVYEADGVSVRESAEPAFAHLARLSNTPHLSWEQARQEASTISFAESLTEVDRYFDQLTDWTTKPFAQALADRRAAESLGNELRNPFSRMLSYRLTQLHADWVRAETSRRGTQLLARVLAFQRRHGRLPERLSDLGETSFVVDLRRDPFGSGEFIYTRTRDDFVLYSVGLDGKDDAARPYLPGKSAGDLLFWPMAPSAPFGD